MVEKTKVSLWDLLVYILSGLMVVLVFTNHALRISLFATSQLQQFLEEISLGISLIITPMLLYLLGILLEPAANFVEKSISLPVRKKIGLRNYISTRDEYEKLIKVIKQECIPQKYHDHIDVYHWCKDHLLLKGTGDTFMVFLAKYGFYRNSSFLLFINGVISPILHGVSVTAVFETILSFVFAYFFSNRAITFYDHMSGIVYRGFLVYFNENEKANKHTQ